MIRVDVLGASMATGKLEPFKVQDLEVEDLEAQDLEAQDLKAQGRFVSRAPVSSSFWRMAVLTAAAAIGVASQAEATIYWPDPAPDSAQPAPESIAPTRKRKVRHHSEDRPDGRSYRARRGQQKDVEAQSKDVGAKPHGPLVIAISINKQNMKNLRRQRILRGNADLDRHARSSDADGRVQRHSKREAAPFQHL